MINYLEIENKEHLLISTNLELIGNKISIKDRDLHKEDLNEILKELMESKKLIEKNKTDEDIFSYYIRDHDNHIEIGFARIKLIALQTL